MKIDQLDRAYDALLSYKAAVGRRDQFASAKYFKVSSGTDSSVSGVSAGPVYIGHDLQGSGMLAKQLNEALDNYLDYQVALCADALRKFGVEIE